MGCGHPDPLLEEAEGYKAQRGVYTVSAPDPNVMWIVLEVDFEDLSALSKTIFEDEYREIATNLENYSENIYMEILTPTGRTPDEIRYPGGLKKFSK